jgi:hypothetical protein
VGASAGGVRSGVGRDRPVGEADGPRRGALGEGARQRGSEERAFVGERRAAGEIERRLHRRRRRFEGAGDPPDAAELVEKRRGRERLALFVRARGDEIDLGSRAEQLREEEALLIVPLALDRQVGQKIAQPRAQAVGQERIGTHGARKAVAREAGDDDPAKGAAARLGHREQRHAAAGAAERRGVERAPRLAEQQHELGGRHLEGPRQEVRSLGEGSERVEESSLILGGVDDRAHQVGHGAERRGEGLASAERLEASQELLGPAPGQAEGGTSQRSSRRAQGGAGRRGRSLLAEGFWLGRAGGETVADGQQQARLRHLDLCQSRETPRAAAQSSEPDLPGPGPRSFGQQLSRDGEGQAERGVSPAIEELQQAPRAPGERRCRPNAPRRRQGLAVDLARQQRAGERGIPAHDGDLFRSLASGDPLRDQADRGLRFARRIGGGIERQARRVRRSVEVLAGQEALESFGEPAAESPDRAARSVELPRIEEHDRGRAKANEQVEQVAGDAGGVGEAVNEHRRRGQGALGIDGKAVGGARVEVGVDRQPESRELAAGRSGDPAKRGSTVEGFAAEHRALFLEAFERRLEMLLAETSVEQVADRPLRAGKAVDQGLEVLRECPLAPCQALDHDRQEQVARVVGAPGALEHGASEATQGDDLEPQPGRPDAGQSGE